MMRTLIVSSVSLKQLLMTMCELNGDDTSMDVIEIAISQLNALWRNVERMNTLYPQCDGLLENLQSLIRCIENMKRYVIF